MTEGDLVRRTYQATTEAERRAARILLDAYWHDELVRARGPRLPEFAVPGEEPTVPDGVRPLWASVRAAAEDLDRFQGGDFSRHVTTGIEGLDRRLGGGIRRGTMVLLGAPTGAGKSTLLQAFCAAAAGRGGALLVSPEMSATDLAQREMVRRSGQPAWLRSPWKHYPGRDDACAAHARAASALLEEQPPLLVLDRPGVTMGEVEEAARDAKALHRDLGLVAVDYAQEVADTDPKAPRYLTVGAVAQRSVELARRLDVAVIIASQVNVVKAAKGPSEYAIRESQILEHKAHAVLLFVVDWTLDAYGKRAVDRAVFRCIKHRSGALFEHEVRYEPGVYTVRDL